MIRRFLAWPDRRLRCAAAPVDGVTAEIHALWDDMIETMEAMPGYGLAAPQVGVMLRLAVVDASDGRGASVRLANPEVIRSSADLWSHDEASPNLPGVSACVERPREVTVRFLNAAGETEERVFRALWATSVQHQIDHLDGRMFFDRLSPLRRQMLLRKAAKAARR